MKANNIWKYQDKILTNNNKQYELINWFKSKIIFQIVWIIKTIPTVDNFHGPAQTHVTHGSETLARVHAESVEIYFNLE